MQALGFIETKGLLAAIEAVDVMLKSADVMLIEKVKVGGGLIAVTIAGDVAAVSCAVDAGAAAVEQIHQGCLVSRHVIARPHEEMGQMIGYPQTKPEENVLEENLQKESVPEACSLALNREVLDQLNLQGQKDQMLALLEAAKVRELRTLARSYKELEISGRRISKANRFLLLKELKNFYGM